MGGVFPLRTPVCPPQPGRLSHPPGQARKCALQNGEVAITEFSRDDGDRPGGQYAGKRQNRRTQSARRADAHKRRRVHGDRAGVIPAMVMMPVKSTAGNQP